MRGLFIATRAISKLNKIIKVLVKESSKILKYSNRVQLIRISRQIKNISRSWNGICDNDDLFNIWDLNGLINPISNGKKFCFSKYDIYSMMNCFCNNILIIIYMWNWSNDIILDTSIGYNYNIVWVWDGIIKDFIKFLSVSGLGFCILVIYYMEKKMIR